jgi:hypothetical protein
VRTTRNRLWLLARRYWFDAVIVIGLGVFLGTTVHALHDTRGPGPQGPLWFDIIAGFAFFLPLFWRRRFPFGAPAASAIAVAASSLVDGRLAVNSFVAWMLVMAVAFLLGSLPERRQAVAGLVIVQGATAILVRNDPKRSRLTLRAC